MKHKLLLIVIVAFLILAHITSGLTLIKPKQISMNWTNFTLDNVIINATFLYGDLSNTTGMLDSNVPDDITITTTTTAQFLADVIFFGNVSFTNGSQVNGTIFPGIDGIFDIGNESLRYRNIYAIGLNISGCLNASLLTVDCNNGRVGIGVSLPQQLLHVEASFPNIAVNDTGAGASTIRFTNNGGLFVVGKDRSSGGSILTGSLGNAGVITTRDVNALQFGTDTVVRMTIASGGNVGIGTATPGRLLTVVGTSSPIVNISAGSNGAAPPADSVLLVENDGAAYITISAGAATQAGLFIGESTDTNKAGLIALHDTNQDPIALRQDNQNRVLIIGYTMVIGNDLSPDASLEIINDGSGVTFLAQDASDGESTPFIIDANGNVGFGTTAPTQKGNVVGDFNVTGDSIVEGFLNVSCVNCNSTFMGDVIIAGVLSGGSDLTIASANILGMLTTNEFQVTQNFTVPNNISAANIFPPTYWFGHNNATLDIPAASVWTNITFDETDNILSSGVTHTANSIENITLTLGVSGVYEIDYYLTFIDSTANPVSEVAARLVLNGVEIHGSLQETDITKQNSEVEVVGGVLVMVVAGDTLELQFNSNSTNVNLQNHQEFGDEPSSAVMKIKRIG